jgi:hypothetical protein
MEMAACAVRFKKALWAGFESYLSEITPHEGLDVSTPGENSGLNVLTNKKTSLELLAILRSMRTMLWE